MTGATDLDQREAVEAFVESTLDAMPEHLRAAVVLASVGLGGLTRIADVVLRPERTDGSDPVVSRLREVRLGPMQQYFRLFRSLVLFAEHETSVEPST